MDEDMFDDDDLNLQGIGVDETKKAFYEKLADLPTSWTTMEGEDVELNYRCVENGKLALDELKHDDGRPCFNQYPQLNYFMVAQARYGGPIALMCKHNAVIVGQQKPKHLIFLFDGFGKHYKTIDMAYLCKMDKTQEMRAKYLMIAFNSEEDLIVVQADGAINFVDIVAADLKDHGQIPISDDFNDCRLDAVSNLLVIKTIQCEFWYLNNVKSVETMGMPKKLNSDSLTDKAHLNFDFIIYKSSPVEILAADYTEGIHLIKDSSSRHILQEIEEGDETEPFGHIKLIAINPSRQMIALYNDTDCSIIVLDSTLRNEVNRAQHDKLNQGSDLAWSQMDCVVLAIEAQHKLCIVVNKAKSIYFETDTTGIKFIPELDGLRVITSNGTHFLERVKEQLEQTFQIASIEPSAKLHTAMRSIDYNNPRADEIIRELTKKEPDQELPLTIGIKTLMEAAKYEHYDMDVLKHLLRTASFAKKFSDPEDLDPQKYVELVKTSVVLSMMRNSQQFRRAITYTQLKDLRPKNMVRHLLRFKDYQLAVTMIEILKLPNMSAVYEDWCMQMIRHSRLREEELKERFTWKFEELSGKLAIDQGFTFGEIELSQQACKRAKDQIGLQGGEKVQPVLLGRVKLGVDFTKLAKIADSQKKKLLSSFLIGYEKQIVKIIPFLLDRKAEKKEFNKALQIAIEGGDPNNINKVIQVFLQDLELPEAVEKISEVPGGLRCLRNFAKKRRETQILEMIYKKKATMRKQEIEMSGLPENDMTHFQTMYKTAFDPANMARRIAILESIAGQSKEIFRDNFQEKAAFECRKFSEIYPANFKELIPPGQKGSLSETIQRCVREKTKDSVSKELKSVSQMTEQLYYTNVMKAFCETQDWPAVENFIRQKSPACPFPAITELAFAVGDVKHAQDACRKIQNVDQKIELTLMYKWWHIAAEEIIRHKRQEDYFDQFMRTAPPGQAEQFWQEAEAEIERRNAR